MSEHSTIGLGGSTSDIVMNCPPARQYLIDAPPKEETVYMRDGTTLHSAMEVYLTTGETPEVEEKLRPKLIDAMGLWDTLAADPTVVKVHSELRLHIAHIPGAFGTVDVLIEHSDNRITILDFKFGDGVQVSAKTPQLKFYALAALTDPSTKDLFDAQTTIRLMIMQPGFDPIRQDAIDIVDLFAFGQKLGWAVDNIANLDTMDPGDHCRWCPAKPVCPKIREMATQAVAWSDPLKLTPAEVGEALSMASYLESWAKDIRAYAHERLEHSQEVPGFKLVAKKANRSWVSEAKVVSWAKAEGYNEIHAKAKLLSPAQMAKLYDVPAGLIERKPAGTSMVADSDKREAVVPAAALGNLGDKLRVLNIK